MTEFLRFKRGKEVLEYPKLPASFEGNAFLPQRAFIPIAFDSKKHPETLVMKGETVPRSLFRSVYTLLFPEFYMILLILPFLTESTFMLQP